MSEAIDVRLHMDMKICRPGVVTILMARAYCPERCETIMTSLMQHSRDEVVVYERKIRYVPK